MHTHNAKSDCTDTEPTSGDETNKVDRLPTHGPGRLLSRMTTQEFDAWVNGDLDEETLDQIRQRDEREVLAQ